MPQLSAPWRESRASCVRAASCSLCYLRKPERNRKRSRRKTLSLLSRLAGIFVDLSLVIYANSDSSEDACVCVTVSVYIFYGGSFSYRAYQHSLHCTRPRLLLMLQVLMCLQGKVRKGRCLVRYFILTPHKIQSIKLKG